MFDPSKYKITTSAEYEVVDAAGQVIYLDDAQTVPWTITVASPGTKKALKAQHELKQATSGDLLTQMKGRKSSRNEDSETNLRADYLMKVTEGTNAVNLTYAGKTGLDALRAIYLDPLMMHVPKGLDVFHSELGNFTGDSVKTASSTPDTSHG